MPIIIYWTMVILAIVVGWLVRGMWEESKKR